MKRKRNPVVAPVKEPKVIPIREPVPTKEPKRDPYIVPKPGVLPKPKAYQQFWCSLKRDSRHLFKQNPILSKYGLDLAEKSAAIILKRTREKNILRYDPELALQLRNQINEIEANYLLQIDTLAKKVTHQIWGINLEQLNGEINKDIDSSDLPDKTDTNWHKLDKETQNQIHKRLIINTIIQGGAVYTMQTGHYLVEKELKELDVELLRLYDLIVLYAIIGYYTLDAININADVIEMMKSLVAGKESIDYTGAKPIIKAEADNFPILCQEYGKGSAEVLGMYQFVEMSYKQNMDVIDVADQLEYEIPETQIGIELWRRLLLRKKKVNLNLADFLMQLFKLESGSFMEYVEGVILSGE